MLGRLAAVVTARPRVVLVVAALFAVVAGVIGVGAISHLKNGGFADPAADSSQAAEIIADHYGGSTNFVLLVQARQGRADSPAMSTFGSDLTGQLAGHAKVDSVVSYWGPPGTPPAARTPALLSQDGRTAVISAHVQGDDSAAGKIAKDLAAQFGAVSGPGTVIPGGPLVIGNEVTSTLASDLALAEAVAVPLTLILLVFVFRSLVAALLPVAIAVLSVVGSLLALRMVAAVTDVSIFALNLVTALSLGLAVDYSLLMVSRYREEMRGGADSQTAILTTVRTAGRTIVFSAVTVAVALAAMLVFPLYFLRSFAYAGVAVVVVAAGGALIVLPALLKLTARRLDRGGTGRHRYTPPPGSATWRRITSLVSRHPVAAGLPVLLLLLGAGVPFLHAQFGAPDDRVLPASAPSHRAGDLVRNDFGSDPSTQMMIVFTGMTPHGETLVPQYATALSGLDHAGIVQASSGTYLNGRQVAPPSGPTTRVLPGGITFLTLVPTVDVNSAQAASLVQAIRAEPTPDGLKAYVGGVSASTVDGEAAIAHGVPTALLIVAVAMFIVLFLYTGSLILPLKALALNTLSLTAIFGSMVWIFQDGHLRSLLGITPMPLNVAMPVLMFCVAFGLSMDYEVFLLSRVKEAHHAGMGTAAALVEGVSRTAGILTAAAALLGITLFALATSSVNFVQMFGIGTGLAIIVDATLIRGVLVPSFMRLMGETNWWAPWWMQQIHQRLGISDT